MRAKKGRLERGSRGSPSRPPSPLKTNARPVFFLRSPASDRRADCWSPWKKQLDIFYSSVIGSWSSVPGRKNNQMIRKGRYMLLVSRYCPPLTAVNPPPRGYPIKMHEPSTIRPSRKHPLTSGKERALSAASSRRAQRRGKTQTSL